MTPSTERLLFKTWSQNDLKNALRLWADPEVMTFIGGQLSSEQILIKLEKEISCHRRHNIQYWPIFSKADGSFVGCCGLKPWVYSQRGRYELGFHLIKEAWGKGYALEAAKGVIQFAKNNKLEGLMAGHHPGNSNSKKVLEKLGFKFVEDVFFPPTGLMHPSYLLSAT